MNIDIKVNQRFLIFSILEKQKAIFEILFSYELREKKNIHQELEKLNKIWVMDKFSNMFSKHEKYLLLFEPHFSKCMTMQLPM